ncbi:MAG: lipoyl(octanoyl) transferase LipB [Candidatus Kariarchaeaceae archaeon]|jgi:lipoate-protein ligase B
MNETLETQKTQWQIQEYEIIDYQKGLTIQESYKEDVIRNNSQNILLLEHEPVITLGRRTDPSHVLLTETELKQRGIALYKVDRGGSATYHGPGQLVGYIIAKANRFGGIHAIVTSLLKALQHCISDLGIMCSVDYENPGIWTTTTPEKKLAAVGMQVKDGVTQHGFAINIDLPLGPFGMIVPCGLSLPVSTLAIELGERMNVGKFREKIIPYLISHLSRS